MRDLDPIPCLHDWQHTGQDKTVIIFGRKWSTFDYHSSAASSLIWLNFHRVANDSHFRRSPVVLVAIFVGVSGVYTLPILSMYLSQGAVMDQTGIVLALIGIAVGLVLLGLLVAFVPLRTFVQLRWRFFFGPYPLLMIYTWVDKVGLIEDRKQAVSFFDSLRQAGTTGQLEFYGQAIRKDGKEPELRQIPPEHLRSHAIRVPAVGKFTHAGNEQICTYDEKRASRRRFDQPGCYCNLHVSRKVLRIIKRIWNSA